MKPHPAAATERPLSALDAIFTRRSVRAYEHQRVEQSTIRALLDAAVQAPTAMHEEPWLFIVVQDRVLLHQLSDRVKATWMRDATPKSERRAERRSELHGEFIERLRDPGFDVFYGAGTLIVICARRMDTFVVADCWLAAQNLMLAATALALGTCCIGAAVEALNSKEMKAAVGIPADVHAVAPIVVGVPAGNTPAVARREPDIVSWK
jgi:nitroreductase